MLQKLKIIGKTIQKLNLSSIITRGSTPKPEPRASSFQNDIVEVQSYDIQKLI